MIYSVWNQPARKYDYFESNGVQAVANTPTPKHVRSRRSGVSIESALWPLPGGSVKVGSGDLVRGRLASPRAGLSGFMPTSTAGMVGLGLAAYILWRIGFAEQ
jgi:hypothetical protein